MFMGFPAVTVANFQFTKELETNCTEMGYQMALYDFPDKDLSLQLCKCDTLACETDYQLF